MFVKHRFERCFIVSVSIAALPFVFCAYGVEIGSGVPPLVSALKGFGTRTVATKPSDRF